MIDQSVIERLVEHFVNYEFTNGAFGDSGSDAIYLVASLSKDNQGKFINEFITRFRSRLESSMPTGLTTDEAKVGFDEFAKFNVDSGRAYRLDW